MGDLCQFQGVSRRLYSRLQEKHFWIAFVPPAILPYLPVPLCTKDFVLAFKYPDQMLSYFFATGKWRATKTPVALLSEFLASSAGVHYAFREESKHGRPAHVIVDQFSAKHFPRYKCTVSVRNSQLLQVPRKNQSDGLAFVAWSQSKQESKQKSALLALYSMDVELGWLLRNTGLSVTLLRRMPSVQTRWQIFKQETRRRLEETWLSLQAERSIESVAILQTVVAAEDKTEHHGRTAASGQPKSHEVGEMQIRRVPKRSKLNKYRNPQLMERKGGGGGRDPDTAEAETERDFLYRHLCLQHMNEIRAGLNTFDDLLNTEVFWEENFWEHFDGNSNVPVNPLELYLSLLNSEKATACIVERIFEEHQKEDDGKERNAAPHAADANSAQRRPAIVSAEEGIRALAGLRTVRDSIVVLTHKQVSLAVLDDFDRACPPNVLTLLTRELYIRIYLHLLGIQALPVP